MKNNSISKMPQMRRVASRMQPRVKNRGVRPVRKQSSKGK